MKKEPAIFLRHIVLSCQAIEKYTQGLSKEDFQNDEKAQDAVMRRIEIIGEVVKNLPNDFRKQYPEIEWKKQAGMRDVLIHEYFGVDLNLVWQTAQDLLIFRQAIEKILENLGGQEVIDF